MIERIDWAIAGARSASWALMPPAGLIWLSLLGCILWPKWRRLGGVLVAGSAIGIAALSLPITAYALLSLSQEPADDLATAEPDDAAIVVLGGDVLRGASEYAGVTAGALSLERLRYGARVHRRTALPILLSGGPLLPDEPPLAEVLGEVLTEDFRIQPAWLESRSRNTAENARFSAELLRENGITTAVVVTHAWHMRRAAAAFRAVGIRVLKAPTLAVARPTGWDMIIPQTAALHRSFFGMHEIVGGWFYRLMERVNS